MTSDARFLFALLSCAALVGCGEVDPSPDPPRSVRVLELPRDASGAVHPSFELLVWAAGPASLEIAARGPGSGAGRGRVACELEGGDRTTLLTIEEVDPESGLVTASAALPELAGGDLHAMRLAFEAEDGLAWIGARIVEPAGERPVLADALSGSLRGRNVVLFLTDALHADHMGCYGSELPTTPTLDRVAAQGVRFAVAYSQTSWTLPSVASLFTGLEQERHGVTYLTARLSEEPATLAEQFRTAGYRTMALVQNGVVWTQTGLDRGFERYELFEWTPESFRELVDEVEALLAQPAQQPLFLYVHVIPPHGPFTTPEDFLGRFDLGYEGRIDGSVESAVRLNREGLGPDHPDVIHFTALYDEFLAYADSEIGRLIGGVEDAGRAAEFAFVHVSDHGEAFMQHGVLGHALHVYEEQVRVPFILYAPGSALPSGTVVEQPVSLLDLLPTLVDLCGLPAPLTPTSGRSLVPSIAGAQEPARPLVLSSRYRGDAAVSPFIGLRLGKYKLVCRRDGPPRLGWQMELFDLERDPGEQHDVSGEHSLLVATMERELRRFVDTAAAGGHEAVTAGELDEEVMEQLRALGYVSDQ